MNNPQHEATRFARATIGGQPFHRRVGASLGSIALLGMATAFALSSTDSADDIHPQTVLEQLSTPTTTLNHEDAVGFLHEEQIQPSDTLASLLSRLGVTEPSALEFIRQTPSAQSVARQLRPGKVVAANTGMNGELISLHFPLNNQDTTLVIERRGNGFFAAERRMQLEAGTEVRSGEIRSSLFAATDDAGIPDAIATQLAEVFGAEIDFYRSLRKGDRFSVVYETLTHRGQIVRTGRILCAEFTNAQRVLSAYWFKTRDGKEGYYTADGKSLRKAFLRTPLEFSRVTSGFSNARLHPILQTTRAHKGIDYGAPTGTRVRSVADGTVASIGKQNGYGNLIVIKHQGAYSTAYGHLSRFGQGLRKGSRVSQGETIGYVGQTGLASGPHLHYEFRINDRQIDPLTLNIPDTPPMAPAEIEQFRAATATARGHLDLAKQTAIALSD
jgi:murein DD-endopeptidase MepM/ murein hydrolase activator NlpD